MHIPQSKLACSILGTVLSLIAAQTIRADNFKATTLTASITTPYNNDASFSTSFQERDLLGSLLPLSSAPDPPKASSLSSPPPTPAAPEPVSSPLPPTFAPVTESPKAPTSSSGGGSGTGIPGLIDQILGPDGSSDDGSGDDSSGGSSGLSGGLIAMIVIVLLGIATAVLVSCYKIRQTNQRRKRRESWDEDILKNHISSVGRYGRNRCT
ncbi:hypothetical protein EDD21DRAFT_404961 [Dissophora ornata]|nr:hypothetical protein EDD21DRAFT_404961 [Dissophora ornata]